LLSPVEEIKNRLDIVDVISGYIKLQKAGRNFRARCPFHSEKTPSFMVSPERQIWHCFGCGKGGDIFGFVKEIEGTEFVDALRTLAQRAGVILKKQDPKTQTERQRLYKICELAARFFQKQLEASSVGKKIEKYLAERGINKNSMRDWRLGYAPDSWETLSQFLKSRGYTDGEIIKSGVAVEKEKSQSPNSNIQYYDRFRGRIMFPIFDLNGQVVGFAGRVAPGGDEKSAKYVNTPQTLIYDKGRLLYGLDKAKIEIKRKNFCVLVEGNTDVIMSHQAGVFNVVASSGTALTEEHLKIIKRYTDNLVLAFDTDLAGINATKRTANLALSQGFNAKIIVTPSGKRIKDPADLIRENPRAWEKIISSAQGIIEFCLSDALARHDIKTANGKKEAAKELLPLFKKIADPIEQAHWIGELAKKLRVAEKLLSEALNKISSPREALQTQNKTQTIKTNQPKSRRLRLEEELIGSIVGTSEPKEAINEILKWQNINKIENVFNAPHTKNIFKNLAQHLQKSQITDKINLTKLQSGLLPEQTIYLNQIILIAEIRQIDPQKHTEHINSCLISLKKEIIREKMEKLQYEIKNLEDKNDRKKLFNLLDKFKSLSQQLIT
jgi:DNA primase